MNPGAFLQKCCLWTNLKLSESRSDQFLKHPLHISKLDHVGWNWILDSFKLHSIQIQHLEQNLFLSFPSSDCLNFVRIFSMVMCSSLKSIPGSKDAPKKNGKGPSLLEEFSFQICVLWFLAIVHFCWRSIFSALEIIFKAKDIFNESMEPTWDSTRRVDWQQSP